MTALAPARRGRPDTRAKHDALAAALAPDHVVVDGAGRRPTSVGRRILANLQGSFAGRIDVVHPSAAGQAVTELADLGAPVGIAVRIGALVAAVPEIVELDLNPVIATPGGAVVVDARVGVARGPTPQPERRPRSDVR